MLLAIGFLFAFVVLPIMGLRAMFGVGCPACPKCGSKQGFRWNQAKTQWICKRCGGFGDTSGIWYQSW